MTEMKCTCKHCGKYTELDFDLPNDVWLSVVPEKYRTLVLCLTCFDGFAFEKNIQYVRHIRKLYFSGTMAAADFSLCQFADGPFSDDS